MRVNAEEEQSTSGCEAGKACTLQVSPSGAVGTAEAQFWTASADGERAIFSIVGGLPAEVGNLYEYTFNPATGTGSRAVIAGKTLGVAGASEDAERLYFASREICSSAPNSEGDVAVEGAPNLYLYEKGESCAAGEIDFVGTLAAPDAPSSNQVPSPLAAVPRYHIARAGTDGGQLLFVSAASLTGYDNADAVSGEADREVYLYDAEAAGGPALRCVSCNPSGARPHGADVGLWAAAYIPGYQHQLYGRRPLAAGGHRVFFNSLDPLSIRDTNGAQDVYQWEAPGTGGCSTASAAYSAQNEGCIDLISSGKSPRDAEWVDASADGDDVFFRTEASLVGADPGSVDIYDARVNGGYAEATPSPTCAGDSCQSVPAAPPYASPGTASHEGPGNQAAGRECDARARKAQGLSSRAHRLRRNARKVARPSPSRARGLRRRAQRLAHRAKANSSKAKRCRRNNRRAAK